MSVTYYPINEDTARNAHYMAHMGDYKPGSATASYRAAVDEAAAPSAWPNNKTAQQVTRKLSTIRWSSGKPQHN